MWIAVMESEHFSWYAVGDTEIQAVDSIETRWNESESRESLTAKELQEYYGIYTVFLQAGECVIR